MKKKIGFIIIGLVLVVGVFLFFFLGNKTPKRVYLSRKYYHEGERVEVTSKELKKLENDTYLLFTYNSYCAFPISCDSIFEEALKSKKIDFMSIPFAEFRKTDFYKTVEYAPSMMIIQNNKVIAYLDADQEGDVEKYQDVNAFIKWLEKYIYLEKE